MPDLQQIIAQRFAQAIRAAFGPEHAGVDPVVRPAANPKFGDYQANVAMGLAKTLGRKPRDVAQAIVAALPWQGLCREQPTLAGPGFINLTLADDFLAAQAAALVADPRLGVPVAARPQRVVVDYPSPNLAKEMHVGHLRPAIIGDCLARVLEFAGHTVLRQNHAGDWGTQFGMILERLADLGWQSGADHTIQDLDALYKEAKARFDAEPDFADRARQRVVALQAGDPATLGAWQMLIDESGRHMYQLCGLLGVRIGPADYRPESFYNPRLPGVVEDLRRAGHAVESEGAVCLFPPGFVNPEGAPLPMIVRKSGGGFGYAATDLAALRFRAVELKADRIVYLTDARQKQHFAMLFAAGAMVGWVRPGLRLEHVVFGTIQGEDGKPFKTRSGEAVRLSDLLAEAQERALAVVTQKNPDLPADQRQAVARAVGLGAVKYADLCGDRIKDYVFNWDRMLSFDGNTAPYVQNAYVRVRSIFRKARARGLAAEDGTGPTGPGQETADARQRPPTTLDLSRFLPPERAMVLKLLQYPAAVAGVEESLEPHRLCAYLYDLATLFHSFYERCTVLDAADPAACRCRLTLCDLTARTLRGGLDLLGIDTVEQM